MSPGELAVWAAVYADCIGRHYTPAMAASEASLAIAELRDQHAGAAAQDHEEHGQTVVVDLACVLGLAGPDSSVAHIHAAARKRRRR